MRKCPKCNKDIPANTLLIGTKTKPIICPHCQSKFVYDYRSIFLLTGWWSIAYAIYFIHKAVSKFMEKGGITNIDLLLLYAVGSLSFLIRFKFAVIKPMD